MWSFKIRKWKPRELSCEESEVPGGEDSTAGQGFCETRPGADVEPNDTKPNDEVSISVRCASSKE